MRHAATWGDWFDRPDQFYVECAERAAELEWANVLAIAGPELAHAADVLSNLVAIASAGRPPARVVLGTLTVTAIHGDSCTVTTYSPYDPIELPLGLLEALEAFDGRPTSHALDELARERDIDLDPALMRKLFDFGVLVDPESA